MNDISANDIAIIGMSGRFPQADSIEKYWENLVNGVNSIIPSDENQLLAVGIKESDFKDPRFVNANASIEGAKYFDADFFGLSNAEATILDPQIRMLLETSWKAIEDAGYDIDRINVPVGNFCGMSANSYLVKMLETNKIDEAVDPLLYRILNDKDFLATWISYKLNLTGPTFSVQTACSTSLLAVHLACQSLLNHECEMALAGGVTYDSSESIGYFHVAESIYSKDGVCRPFDHNASGTVMGDGVATVVLKRAEDAVRDKDHIYGLIKGTAVNNDGSNKQGFTTPSVDCQRDVILEALAVSDIDPETIGLIEAHGTATLIGDPIEVTALKNAYRKYTSKNQYCAIGSVKSNIGHLDAAAGIASLIKAVLCVEKGYMVPSINYAKANPVLELESSPFYVSEKYAEWPEEFEIRRAGVSSLGVGGTNVHVIVEQPPVAKNNTSANQFNIVALSAASQKKLQEQKNKLAQYLTEKDTDFNLEDLEFTSLYGRKAMAFRFSALSLDQRELVKQLLDQEQVNTFTGSTTGKKECVFMFPGQGSQYPKMTADLYQQDTDFKKDMDICFEYLKTSFGFDLKSILFNDQKELLNKTENTQPALFIVEYCLAKSLLRSGIKPKGFIGHSVGEFVAAVISGCLSLKDALKLVYHRGQLMGSMPEGAMLLVMHTEEELKPLLIDSVSICAFNAGNNIVIGGSMDAIEQQKALLEINKVECKKLRVSHAYHTNMMQPVLAELAKVFETISFNKFNLPVFSTFTGERVAPELFCTADYWLQQIISPVQFTNAVKAAVDLLANPLFVEVGPGNGLSSFVRIIDPASDTVSLLPKTSDDSNDLLKISKAKAQLFVKGVYFNIPEHHKGSRISLPTYTFNKKYFWKPRLNVRFDSLKKIKDSYHFKSENFKGDTLRTKIEIQLPGKDQFSENLLAQLEELQSQYLESVEQLLNNKDQVKNSIEVLFDKIINNDQGLEISEENNVRRLSNPFVEPQTDTEKLVATHWESILGYQPAGLMDDFFDAGGNSLLATMLINRINQELNINISIADILSSSNVKNLVQIIEEKQWLAESNEKVNEIII